MKKLLATILIAMLAISCLFAFVGCDFDNDNYGDSNKIYVGVVSKATFVSAQSAVNEFLKREVSGRKLTADYIEYSKIENLTQSEINKLQIKDEYLDGIVNVEKGVVEYFTNTSSSKSKRELYIITYNTGLYRYISPAVNIGETLTASYYSFILDSKKYLNSTVTIVGANSEVLVYKFGVNSIYQSINYDYFYSGESVSFSKTNYVYYNNEDMLYSYYNYNDKWNFDYQRVEAVVSGNVSGFEFANVISNYLNEIFYYYLPFGELDHSDFVMTATGFSLRNEIEEFTSGNASSGNASSGSASSGSASSGNVSSGNVSSGNVSSGNVSRNAIFSGNILVGNNLASGELDNVTLEVVLKGNIITEVNINSDNKKSKVSIFDIRATKVDLPKEFLDKIQ